MWFGSKGAIWTSFMVPNALLLAARGSALFVPDYRMWKSCPALAPPGVQEEHNLRTASPVSQCCSPLTCWDLWFSENGEQPSDI